MNWGQITPETPPETAMKMWEWYYAWRQLRWSDRGSYVHMSATKDIEENEQWYRNNVK